LVCACVWEYTYVYISVKRDTPSCCDCFVQVCGDIVIHTCDMPLESVRRASFICDSTRGYAERWGAGVETQKNVRGEIGGWGRVPFNEAYAPSLNTIYDGA